MQLIISIYEVLNAKRRHYARVPSLTGRDVLDEFVCDDRSANCFFTFIQTGVIYITGNLLRSLVKNVGLYLRIQIFLLGTVVKFQVI